MALPVRRPPFGLGLLCPGLSQVGPSGPWRTWWSSSVVLRFRSRPGLGLVPLSGPNPQRGQRVRVGLPGGVSILEALPVVRRFLVLCSGRFPSIQGETLGASGALQAHLVQTISAITWGKDPQGIALSQVISRKLCDRYDSSTDPGQWGRERVEHSNFW